MNKKNAILFLVLLMLPIFVLPKTIYAEHNLKEFEKKILVGPSVMANKINLGEPNGRGYYSSVSPEVNVSTIDENKIFQNDLFEQLSAVIKQVDLSVAEDNILSILLDGSVDFTPYLTQERNIKTFYINVGNPSYKYGSIAGDYSLNPTKNISFSDEIVDIKLPVGNEYQINFDFFTNYNEHIKFNMIGFNLEDISLAKIETQPHTIVVGSNAQWDINDSVIKVIDATGNEIDPSSVTVSSGQVDVTQPGTYELEYTYIDIFNNTITATSVVYVVETKAEIKTRDIVMEGGKDPWSAELNFIEAVDGQGNDIDLSKIQVHSEVDINTAGTYTVEYTYTDESGNIITSESLVTIFFTEEIESKGNVIVKYVDELGNQLLEELILEGNLGDSYTTTSQEIDDYTLDIENLPLNAEGVYGEEDIFVIYSYKKIEEEVQSSNVIVRYVDELGNNLLEELILEGNLGAAYSTTPREIEGYVLDTEKLPLNATGIYEEEAIVIIYIYKKIQSSNVIVRYVDELGNKLLEESILEGNLGDMYSTTPREIEGYVLDIEKLPLNAAGIYKEYDIVVMYTYKKVEEEVEVKRSNVIVKYVDELGNNLLEELILGGNLGDTYSTTPREIEGYVLDTEKLPLNAAGIYEKEDISVIYTYKKIEEEVQISNVVVKYIDELGDDLLEDTILEGKLGDTYATTVREIEGYTVDTENLPVNEQGIYEEDEITIVYMYKKIEESTVDPFAEVLENESSEGQLPETGEINSRLWSIFGIVTLLSVVGHFFRKKQLN